MSYFSDGVWRMLPPTPGTKIPNVPRTKNGATFRCTGWPLFILVMKLSYSGVKQVETRQEVRFDLGMSHLI